MKHFSLLLLALILASPLCSPIALANEKLRTNLESWSSGYQPMAIGEKLANGEQLRTFYSGNQYALIWHSADGALTKKALALISAINNIGAEGLLPQDYHAKHLSDLLGQPTKAAVDSAGYDLLLSDAFLSLAKHLQAGKVDPASLLTSDWQANRRNSDKLPLLAAIAQAKDGRAVVEDALNGLRPKQIRYQRLVDTLIGVRQLPNTAWEKPLAETPSIKPDVVDSRLTTIARRLVVWGDLAAADAGIEITSYTPVLQQAVKSFQGRHGLDTDGVIGKETILALNISPAQRAQQLEVNLERWRWLAEDLGEKHILVNIAAFELKIIDNNETVIVKPVVVGRNFRKTPVFSNSIKYIVFNPTWTVPYKLAVEDKLPDIKKDPAYFNRLGIKVFRGDSSQAIDTASIDWHSLNKKNFPYRLVQSPGPQNALGQVKFMFPNSHDVYLHDTPSRELFKKSQRAFSSGCIRLADPLELAAYLLKDQQWDAAKISQVVAGAVLQTVHLKKPMPIHIEYWTAWVDSKNTLNFRNDIYERDLPLWLALRKPQ